MSVFGDIGVRPDSKPAIRQMDRPVVGSVWLIHLNYSVTAAFNDPAVAMEEAQAIMALHGGEWIKTGEHIQQWFNRGTGNYVEIVEQAVRGKE